MAAALIVVPLSAAGEINQTFAQATPSVLALRAWNRELPAGSSVRIDVMPSGWQLWASYMLTEHPISALDPLGGIVFPHPPAGRKADYVVAFRTQPRPADAIGPVRLQNGDYRLWQMSPRVPGPDVSRHGLIYDASRITIG